MTMTRVIGDEDTIDVGGQGMDIEDVIVIRLLYLSQRLLSKDPSL
jgi:hypothetical protein